MPYKCSGVALRERNHGACLQLFFHVFAHRQHVSRITSPQRVRRWPSASSGRTATTMTRGNWSMIRTATGKCVARAMSHMQTTSRILSVTVGGSGAIWMKHHDRCARAGHAARRHSPQEGLYPAGDCGLV